MSLDKNLFTLTFTPHKDNPNILDLVDPVGTIHYRKQKIVGSKEYKIELYDPFSESLLATVTSPSAVSKTKMIELYNPTSNVEMRYTGALSFKWSFKWEDNEFEWKREECFIVRKPDPPVIVAVTKDLGRLKPATLQLLDYNINRFEINDRKGLEIVILAVLLTFADANEAAHSADGNAAQSSVLSRKTSAAPSKTDVPPPPPPKPAPKTGVERIAEMQAVQGEYNEIIISDEGGVADYAAYCNKLLQDDAILFVSLKSAEAEQVTKVLQVVEETKRIRHKAGLDEEEGLHQYVLYDQKDLKKGPRVINLDDDDKKKYALPKDLTVHLSKISMPELQPPKSPGNNDKNQKGFNAIKEGKKAVQSLFSRPPPDAPTSRPPPASTTSRPPPAAKTSRPQSAGNTPRPQPAGTTSRPQPAGTTSRPQPAGTTPRPQPPTGRPSSISSLPPPKSGQKLQRPSSKPNISQHMPPYQVHPNQPMPPPHMLSSHLTNPPAYSVSPAKGNYDNPRPPGPPGPPGSFPPPWATGKGPGQHPGLYPPGMPHSNTSPYPYASGSSNFPSGKRPPSPLPPPPPFSAVPTESSGSGSKPQSNASTIVQGASTVVQGFMGLISTGKLK